MPRIPELQENNRMNVGSPVPVADGRGARVSGSSLAAFGEGISRLGGAIAQEERSRKSTRDVLRASDYKNRLQEFAIKEADRILREGEADGSDWTSTFNESFESQSEALLSEISDDELKLRVRAAAGDVKIQYLSALTSAARKNFIEYGQIKADQLITQNHAIVQGNPELFDTKLTDTATLLNEMAANGAIPQAGIPTLLKQYIEDSSVSAVWGYVERGEFDVARQRLSTKFGAMLGVDKVKKLNAEIDSAELKALQIEDRIATRQEKEVEKALKDQKEFMRYQVWKQVFEAESEQDRTSALKRAQEFLTVDAINLSEYKAIEKRLSGDDVETDAQVYMQFRSRIADGERGQKLRDQIMASFMADKLSKADTDKLLTSAAARTRTQRTSDPAFKASYKRAEQYIREFLGGRGPFDLWPQHKKQMVVEASRLMDIESLEKGRDPYRAAQKIVSSFIGGVNQLNPVPGLPPENQYTVDGLTEGAKIIKNLFETKQISKKEYLSRLKQIDERRKAIQAAERAKESADE